MSNDFNTLGYQVIRNAISKESATIIGKSFDMVADVTKYMSPGHDFSDDCPESFCLYAYPPFETLLEHLKPKMEEIVGFPLLSTYTYARVYYENSRMDRHIDRPSCEYSATMTFTIDEDHGPWPIGIQDFNGDEKEVFLYPGDMMIYQGTIMEHWRDDYHGKKQIQAFMHYVDANGEHREHIYDKRPMLGYPHLP